MEDIRDRWNPEYLLQMITSNRLESQLSLSEDYGIPQITLIAEGKPLAVYPISKLAPPKAIINQETIIVIEDALGMEEIPVADFDKEVKNDIDPADAPKQKNRDTIDAILDALDKQFMSGVEQEIESGEANESSKGVKSTRYIKCDNAEDAKTIADSLNRRFETAFKMAYPDGGESTKSADAAASRYDVQDNREPDNH